MRNIPSNTPAAEAQIIPERKLEVVQRQNERLEKLLKWKQEKEKRKLETKKNQKPLFKVCHVEYNEDLNDVFTHIKGKKVLPRGKTPVKKPSTNTVGSASKQSRDLVNQRSTSKQSTQADKVLKKENHGVLGKAEVMSKDGKLCKKGTFVNLVEMKSSSTKKVAEPKKFVESKEGKKTSVKTFTNGKYVRRERKNMEVLPEENLVVSSSRRLQFPLSTHNDYTLTIEKFENPSDNISRRSLRINLQSSNLKDRISPGKEKMMIRGPNCEEENYETDQTNEYGRISNIQGQRRNFIETFDFNNASIASPKNSPMKRTTDECERIDTISDETRRAQGAIKKNTKSPKSKRILSKTTTSEKLNQIVENSDYLTSPMVACQLEQQPAKTPTRSENVEPYWKQILNDSYEETPNKSSVKKRKSSARLVPKVHSMTETFDHHTSFSMVACEIDQQPARSLRKRETLGQYWKPILNEGHEETPTKSSVKKRKSSARLAPKENFDHHTSVAMVACELDQQPARTPRKRETLGPWKPILNDSYEETPNKSSVKKRKSSTRLAPKENFDHQTSVAMVASELDQQPARSPRKRETLGPYWKPTLNDSHQETPNKSSVKKRKSSARLVPKENFDHHTSVAMVACEHEQQPVKSPRKSETLKPDWKLILNDSHEEKTPNKSSVKKRKSSARSVPKLHSGTNKSSTDTDLFYTPDKTEETLNDTVFITPNRALSNDDDCIVYLSPFVTSSRGKAAARREYVQRKSIGGPNLSASDPRSPKAAAKYFTRMLDDEIIRIKAMCDEWQNYKENENLSEDACGLIDMTLGQSNLLISKKFNQFRGLIEQCQSDESSDMKIQCEDLHGFWDMIYKQVHDLEKRFETLEDLKKNNWLEEAPKKKTPKKKKGNGKKKTRSKSASTASSLLKQTILAARKKKAEQEPNLDGSMSVVISKKSTPIPDNAISVATMDSSTPGRGILKTDNTRSEKRKTVVFKDVRKSLGAGKENTPLNARKCTPLPTRKSERISFGRSKLTFD